MQIDSSEVQRERQHPDSTDGINFGAKLVVHLVYDNQKSADLNGHKKNEYAIVNVQERAWFASKEAFMGLVIKSFERLWEEMKK